MARKRRPGSKRRKEGSSEPRMPHDALFKRTFSDPAHLAGELESVLEPELLASLDLSTLELVPGSFVDEELTSAHTDLLFEVRQRGTKKRVLLYVLFEHQSTNDPYLLLRLLEYMARIWRWYLFTMKRGLPVPPILPLVLHHSEEGWKAATSFHGFVDVASWPDALRRHVPDFEILLDDISRMPQAELLARPLSPEARVTLWLLEHARRLADAIERDEVFVLLRAVFTARGDAEALRPYLSYIVEGLAPGLFETVKTRVGAEINPDVETLMKSIADQFRDEGRQQGIEQGIRQGVQQGARAARVSTVLRQLQLKFGPLDAKTLRHIEAASTEALDRIVERVLAASTLAEALE